MKNLARTSAIILSVLALGVVMAYFAGFLHPTLDTTPVPRATGGEMPATVTVTPVREPVLRFETGTIRAKQETVISSRIIATIAAITVRPGDRVARGDVLVELDARELRARLAQSLETLAAARARFEEAEPAHARVKALLETQAVSQAEFDRALAALRTAEANLGSAEQRVEEARTALSYALILAPFDGRVTERYADPGDTAAPAAPIVRLYDPTVLRVEANVRESIAATLSPGDSLSAHIDALRRTVKVQVDEIVPSAEAGSRSVVVKGVLPAAEDLFPGMFTRLAIPVGSATRIYIPRTCVVEVGQLELVYVATQTGPERRLVRTVMDSSSDRVQVRSGLAPGEAVYLAPPAGEQ